MKFIRVLKASYDPNNLNDICKSIAKNIFNKGKITVSYKDNENLDVNPKKIVSDKMGGNTIIYDISLNYFFPLFAQINIKNNEVYLKLGYYDDEYEGNKRVSVRKKYSDLYNTDIMFEDIKQYINKYMKRQFKFMEDNEEDIEEFY